MKAFTILSLLAVLAAANPLPPTTFFLKTEAVDGDKFNGLFVTPSHTFAGGNAGILVDNIKRATPTYLNGTGLSRDLFFNLGPGRDNQYPMQLQLEDLSAAWGTVSINIVDKPDKRFSVSKTGHLIITDLGGHKPFAQNDKGAHWRVCEWVHGGPEIFWNFPITSDNINRKFVPATCALVNLKMVKAT